MSDPTWQVPMKPIDGGSNPMTDDKVERVAEAIARSLQMQDDFCCSDYYPADGGLSVDYQYGAGFTVECFDLARAAIAAMEDER